MYGYRMSEGDGLWLIGTPKYLEQVERELNATCGAGAGACD